MSSPWGSSTGNAPPAPFGTAPPPTFGPSAPSPFGPATTSPFGATAPTPFSPGTPTALAGGPRPGSGRNLRVIVGTALAAALVFGATAYAGFGGAERTIDGQSVNLAQARQQLDLVDQQSAELQEDQRELAARRDELTAELAQLRNRLESYEALGHEQTRESLSAEFAQLQSAHEDAVSQARQELTARIEQLTQERAEVQTQIADLEQRLEEAGN